MSSDGFASRAQSAGDRNTNAGNQGGATTGNTTSGGQAQGQSGKK